LDAPLQVGWAAILTKWLTAKSRFSPYQAEITTEIDSAMVWHTA
jgi:hypothetical protein